MGVIRMGEEYRNSIRDDREVYIDGRRVKDVTGHPMLRPLIDIRARIYDMQNDPRTRAIMTVDRDGEPMIGAALWNARRTGLESQQSVQEKLCELATWREGIKAHLTAAIVMGKRSDAGLLMPGQSLL